MNLRTVSFKKSYVDDPLLHPHHYSQRIRMSMDTFKKLQRSLAREIKNGFERAKKYQMFDNSCVLEKLKMVKGVGYWDGKDYKLSYLTITETRFMGMFFKTDKIDYNKNTYILIEG